MSVRAALVVAAAMVPAAAAHAQEWNSPRALELATRAVERRSGQLAASSLAAYSAHARGYLTFLVSPGDTAIIRPKVVKQDQLAVDVFWRAPGSSKQILVGKRDTLLMPADIAYYRDRFGIVQSNFPDRIRLGDGLDVADVPHPLGTAALASYDFAVTDSMTYTLPNDKIEVYQLSFRPRDASQPRAIGSAYVDVRTADIVGLLLTFTRAAILDKRIDHLSVVLENAFVEQRAWLPRVQHVEVVRSGTWIDIPVLGIIRGRWEVCCYDITFAPSPTLFTGPPIVFSPPEVLSAFKFEGGVLDDLPPDVAIMRQDEIKEVQARAEELVGQAFRDRTQRAAISMPRISDIVRVTRFEGVALGAAARLRPTTSLSVDARARYGFSDEEWKGEVGLGVTFGGGRDIRLFARRDYVDVRDVPEASGVRNSIAAQEFGSDYTDPIDVRAFGGHFTLGRWARARWRVEVAHEEHRGLLVRTAPERGAYEPPVPARVVDGTRISVRADGATWSGDAGLLQMSSELRMVDYDQRAARLTVMAEFRRPFTSGSIETRTLAAALTNGELAPQLAVYFGGPTTAPGYRFDDFAARRGVSQRVEWRTEIPFIPVPLGRFGRVPPHATLAPFVHAVWVDDHAIIPGIDTPPDPTPPFAFRGTRQGWYPAVGVAIEPLMGLVRLDVAYGLRDGRWTSSFDIARIFWSIL